MRKSLQLLPILLTLCAGCSNQTPFPASPTAQIAASQLAEDYLHYTRINSVEQANAIGKQLLATDLNPQQFRAAFNTAAGRRDYRSVIKGATHRPEAHEIATKILKKLDEAPLPTN